MVNEVIMDSYDLCNMKHTGHGHNLNQCKCILNPRGFYVL